MFEFNLKIMRAVGFIFGIIYIVIGYTALVKKAVLAGWTLIVIGVGSFVMAIVYSQKKVMGKAKEFDETFKTKEEEAIDEITHTPITIVKTDPPAVVPDKEEKASE